MKSAELWMSSTMDLYWAWRLARLPPKSTVISLWKLSGSVFWASCLTLSMSALVEFKSVDDSTKRTMIVSA